jgi:hypothetical protein
VLGKLLRDSQGIQDLSDNLQKLNDLMRGFGQKIMEMVEKSGIGLFISRWGPTIKTIVLTGIIVLVILGVIFWMAFKIWRDRERQRAGSEVKTNIKGGNLLHMLLDNLRQGLEKALSSLEGIIDFRQRQRIRAAARIRQIYAELMELCDSLDNPRRDSQTPLEFVPKLEGLFPENYPEIEMITNSYLGVRYGLLPETQDEVWNVEAAWKKLNSAGHEHLAELKRNKK